MKKKKFFWQPLVLVLLRKSILQQRFEMLAGYPCNAYYVVKTTTVYLHYF